MGPAGPAGAPGSTVVGVYQSSGFFQSTKLASTYTEVGRTALAPGNWLVTVSATLANYKSGAWTPVGCTLGTPHNLDQERGFADLGPLSQGGDTQRMTISGAVRTTDPSGTVVILGCFANIDEPNTEVFHVQFSAVKVDDLTVRRTSEP